MTLYYISAKGDPVFHGLMFTTRKLAIAYLAHDTTCSFKNGVWTDLGSGEEIARVLHASLRVE